MKVLVVVPRYVSRPGESYNFPLGLGYIASAIKAAGHTVVAVNLNHHFEAVDEIVARKVREEQPDVCATGSLSPFLPMIQAITAAARKAKPDIVNIVGGGVVSGEPGVILDVADIDVGVVGEGEVTIVELLDCLQRGAERKDVAGIVYRDAAGRTVQTGERPPNRDLGELPWPDYELLEYEKTLGSQSALDNYFFHPYAGEEIRAVDMITSRSCPFHCTFCFHPTGKVYRERPLDDFFAELDHLVARYRINMVAVIDELFSLKRRRLLEFCERIKPYRLQWMVQLHVNSATDETLAAMKDAGCTYISYGIESMSQPVLDSMQKKSKKARIQEALELTQAHRIGIQGNLLFGDAAETLDTANESMHWWAGNRRFQLALSPLSVFPGSPDYLHALRDGLLEDAQRAAFVCNIPPVFNISRLNSRNLDRLIQHITIERETLLNLGHVTAFGRCAHPGPHGVAAYDVQWHCPGCGHHNDYRRLAVGPWHGPSVRLTCRACLVRWDLCNAAYQAEPNQIDDAACASWASSVEALMARGRLQDAHDVALLLRRLAPRFVRGRGLLAEVFRRANMREHLLQTSAEALVEAPFDAERHCDYADVLRELGAFGAARLHYSQALQLAPANGRAHAAIAWIDGPALDDTQRATYFLSWSDDPAPLRRRAAGSRAHGPAEQAVRFIQAKEEAAA